MAKTGTLAYEISLAALTEAALAATEGALARVWLVGPGDLCGRCPMRPECPDRTRCLHLVASAGTTTHLDGPFRRFPLGAREVGRVPIDHRPFITSDPGELNHLADPVWLGTHGIHGFAALPLEYGGHCIGVLAVFSVHSIDPDVLRALRSAAHLGALALGNTRAFQELAQQRNKLAARRARGPRFKDEPDPEVLRPLAESEREIIEQVLVHTAGVVSGPRGAARILGLKPTTLFSRMKKLGVKRARS